MLLGRIGERVVCAALTLRQPIRWHEFGLIHLRAVQNAQQLPPCIFIPRPRIVFHAVIERPARLDVNLFALDLE
jgi:hypothetical protein